MALEYSGVCAREVGRSRELTAERTEQQLRRLCTTGYDLAANVNRSHNRPLYDAALRYHGSWRPFALLYHFNVPTLPAGDWWRFSGHQTTHQLVVGMFNFQPARSGWQLPANLSRNRRTIPYSSSQPTVQSSVVLSSWPVMTRRSDRQTMLKSQIEGLKLK